MLVILNALSDQPQPHRKSNFFYTYSIGAEEHMKFLFLNDPIQDKKATDMSIDPQIYRKRQEKNHYIKVIE